MPPAADPGWLDQVAARLLAEPAVPGGGGTGVPGPSPRGEQVLGPREGGAAPPPGVGAQVPAARVPADPPAAALCLPADEVDVLRQALQLSLQHPDQQVATTLARLARELANSRFREAWTALVCHAAGQHSAAAGILAELLPAAREGQAQRTDG